MTYGQASEEANEYIFQGQTNDEVMEEDSDHGEGEGDSDLEEVQENEEPQTPVSNDPPADPVMSKPATPVTTTKPPAQSGQKPISKQRLKKTKRKKAALKGMSPQRFRVSLQREIIDQKIQKAKVKSIEKSGCPSIPKKYRVWRSDNI